MNNHVVDRRIRQIELEGLPIRTVIERSPNGGLRSRVEKAFAPGILTDRVNIRILWQAANDFGPGFAEVRSLENVRLEVVELVGVHRRVSSSRFELRSFDQADHGPFGNFLGRDVRPSLAAVASQVD